MSPAKLFALIALSISSVLCAAQVPLTKNNNVGAASFTGSATREATLSGPCRHKWGLCDSAINVGLPVNNDTADSRCCQQVFIQYKENRIQMPVSHHRICPAGGCPQGIDISLSPEAFKKLAPSEENDAVSPVTWGFVIY